MTDIELLGLLLEESSARQSAIMWNDFAIAASFTLFVSILLVLYRWAFPKKHQSSVNWFRKHSEWFILPVSLLMWYGLPFALRWIDPTAGSHDIGMLQVPFLALVILYIGMFGIIFLLRFAMRSVYRTFDEFLVYTRTLSEWQRGKFSLALVVALLLTYALIVLAIV